MERRSGLRVVLVASAVLRLHDRVADECLRVLD